MSRLGDRAGGVTASLADSVRDELTDIEETLVQVRGGGWANQPKIRGHLSWVATAAQSQRGISFDAKPTDQLWQRYGDLAADLNAEIVRLQRLVENEMRRLREMIRGMA